MKLFIFTNFKILSLSKISVGFFWMPVIITSRTYKEGHKWDLTRKWYFFLCPPLFRSWLEKLKMLTLMEDYNEHFYKNKGSKWIIFSWLCNEKEITHHTVMSWPREVDTLEIIMFKLDPLYRQILNWNTSTEKWTNLWLQWVYHKVLLVHWQKVAISLWGCFWVLLNRDELVPTAVVDEEKLKMGKELVNVCVWERAIPSWIATLKSWRALFVIMNLRAMPFGASAPGGSPMVVRLKGWFQTKCDLKKTLNAGVGEEHHNGHKHRLPYFPCHWILAFSLSSTVWWLAVHQLLHWGSKPTWENVASTSTTGWLLSIELCGVAWSIKALKN